MVANTILATLAQIVACGPCVGTFGRWKENIQDDDADLWKDLTLFNTVPNAKPPTIPKVVKVVSVTNDAIDDGDVSTLAHDSIQHFLPNPPDGRMGDNHSSTPSEEEKAFSPSPNRRQRNSEGANKNKIIYSNRKSDVELEQVLEEIELEDDPQESTGMECEGGGDAELESIMGPRSQISGMSRKSLLRPPPLVYEEARPPPLLQEMQQGKYNAPCPGLITCKECVHSIQVVERTKSTSSQEDSKEEPCEDIFDACSFKYEEERKNPQDGDDYHDDGSSYSSVRRKLSFFRRNGNKRPFHFRSRSSTSSTYCGRGGSNNSTSSSWLLGHSGLSDNSTGCADHATYATVASTHNCGSSASAYRSSRSRSRHSSANKYKAII